MNNAVMKLAVRSDPFIISSLSTPPEGKSRDLKKNSGTAKKKQRYRCCNTGGLILTCFLITSLATGAKGGSFISVQILLSRKSHPSGKVDYKPYCTVRALHNSSPLRDCNGLANRNMRNLSRKCAFVNGLKNWQRKLDWTETSASGLLYQCSSV